MIEDFHDVLTEFVRSGARFLVVGAHALSAHGVPRATVDLDLWVAPDPDNADRVYRALAAFGAPLEGEIEGVRVPILDRASFIRNKRASGRKKDLADLELLGADDTP